MDGRELNEIKQQILAALRHPEAEDGLYFNNLIVVHEEEERPPVAGKDSQVRQALLELIENGDIVSSGDGDHTIFRMAEAANA
jgi:hypothetical protein